MKISVQLRSEIGRTAVLDRFPDISDTEASRLPWYVTGELNMYVDNELLTDTPLSEGGIGTDYNWMLLRSLHTAFRDILTGKEAEARLLDNPGVFVFENKGPDILCISFDPEVSEEVHSSCISKQKFARALRTATESLESQLLERNSALESSDLITVLRSEQSKTESALDAVT